MKQLPTLFGLLGFATSLLAQSAMPAASSSSASAAALAPATAPNPNATYDAKGAVIHPGGDRPAVEATPEYPQPPLDLHEKEAPRATQMGTVSVTGQPGNGYYYPPMPAEAALPTLWVLGDSTVRNGTLGNGLSNFNQWGWGAPLVSYFDAKKINVVNRAYGGTSSRSFYDGFFWKDVLPRIKKGDFVILQFGANDNAAASLDGTGDETREVAGRRGGAPVNLHTFGWYLKQFVKEAREKGATCIICSLTPRKTWSSDGRMQDNNNHVAWAAQAAKEANAPYIDLHELIQLKYNEAGKAKVDTYYVPWPSAANPRGEGLHTGWDGAVVNAECVVSGLKALTDIPLAGFLSDKAKAVAPADTKNVAANAVPAK